MKTVIYKIAIFASAFIIMASCQTNTSSGVDNNGTGYLVLNQLDVNINPNITKLNKKASTISTDAYIVKIISKLDNKVAYTDTYANFKALTTPLELISGTYTVEVTSPEEIANVGWEKPSYHGSQDVIIQRKETTIAKITCKLSNIQVSVELMPELSNMFKPDTETENNLTIFTSVGTHKEKFLRTETRCLFFKAQNETNTLDLELVGHYNRAAVGDPVDYIPVTWKQQIKNVKAGQWRKIFIRISHINDGTVNFEVTIENWVYDQEIDVDVVTSLVNFGEEAIVDEFDKTTDAGSPIVSLAGGDDISKPYVIDEKSFDFENIFYKKIAINIAPQNEAEIRSFDAVVVTDNAALTAKLTSMGFINNIIPMMPTNGLEDFSHFVNNTFNITNAGMVALYLYGGNHLVKLIAVDKQYRRSYTELEIVVNRPVIVGGPNIVWKDNDFSVTHQLVAESDTQKPVVININSDTGITQFKINIKSEVLTQEVLGFVNLATTMDLINPATEEMNASLRNFGFPTGDQVSGKLALSFDITEFMPMLFGLNNGLTEFTFTVSDGTGTRTETLKINVNKPL